MLDPAELVEIVLADGFREAMSWGTSVYWLRRAGEARWALPRPGDHPGRLSVLDRAEATLGTLRRIYAYESAGYVVWAHAAPTVSTRARLSSFETFAAAELRRLHDSHAGQWSRTEIDYLNVLWRMVARQSLRELVA